MVLYITVVLYECKQQLLFVCRFCSLVVDICASGFKDPVPVDLRVIHTPVVKRDRDIQDGVCKELMTAFWV